MSKKSGYLGRSVSIIGVGYTPMGNTLKSPEIKDFTERELFSMAAFEAMEDAGIESKDIDAFYVGQVAPGRFANLLAGATAMADWVGMRNKPGISHDEACSTANVGLHLAVMAVASGAYDVVLSGGTNINRSKVELGMPPHMREDFTDMWFQMNALCNDSAYLYQGNGVLQPFDAAAVSYAKKYGLSMDKITEVMNRVAVISRRNAVNNPKGLFANETLEDEAARMGFSDVNAYLNSEHNPFFGTLQRLKHTSPASDGASALIVCPTEMAKQFRKRPIEVIGFAQTTALGNHLVGTPYACETDVFNRAYAMSGIKDPYNEVNYMAVHDCSAQHYFTVTEAGGYFHPGEGWQAILDNRIAHDGDKPVNTSGGRLNLGHPLSGAIGIEIAEAVAQMRGEAGPRQMRKQPEVSVVHGYGGGYHINVSVLRAL